MIERQFDDPDIQKFRQMLGYETVKAENGDIWVQCELTQKSHSPSEITALLLARLKADAEAYLSTNVKNVVITVPAYFDNTQIQAVKNAGKIAGFNV